MGPLGQLNRLRPGLGPVHGLVHPLQRAVPRLVWGDLRHADADGQGIGPRVPATGCASDQERAGVRRRSPQRSWTGVGRSGTPRRRCGRARPRCRWLVTKPDEMAQRRSPLWPQPSLMRLKRSRSSASTETGECMRRIRSMPCRQDHEGAAVEHLGQRIAPRQNGATRNVMWALASISTPNARVTSTTMGTEQGPAGRRH